MARRRGRRPMVAPPMVDMMDTMEPPITGPVEQAVQQMPYSYRGLTAQDILQHVVGIKELTPEQLAIADLNQSGDITPGDALWIQQMESGLRDPNTLETITQPAPPPPPPMMPPEGPMMPPGEPMMPPIPVGSPMGAGGPSGPMMAPEGLNGMMPPGPPPMMPDPVQAAVDTMPPGGRSFPGREPKFPGVPPVQIPEPVGPISVPPAQPTAAPPPVLTPINQEITPQQGGGGPTPEQLAQLQIDQEEWSTNPIRFMAEPYWISPNWWENRPAPTIDTEAGGGRGGGRNGAGGRPPVMPPPPVGTEPPVITAPPTVPPPPVGNGDMPPTVVTTPTPPPIVSDPEIPAPWKPPIIDADWTKPDRPWPPPRPPDWPVDKPWPPDEPMHSCPSPKEHIQLANNDWILAGELKVGDEVMTSEDPQKVTFAKTIENSPRREVLFKEGDSIVTSPSHPYFVKDKGFVDVEDLEKGDAIGDLVVKEVQPFSDGPVIHISVDKAETYMLRGGTEENPVPALSHNKLPVPLTKEEMEEQMRQQQEREQRWLANPPQPGDSEYEFFSNWWKIQHPGEPLPQPPTPDTPPAPDDPMGVAKLLWKTNYSDAMDFNTFWEAYQKNPDMFHTDDPVGTAPVGTAPVGTAPVGTAPVGTAPVGTTPTPETTPVQGMTMEEMQKMIEEMQAREAERLAKEAEMSKNYMISDERIGYNPYLSGQYQADPYGPGGVPDMGGITTIPVPQSLTGIGYANYNPRRKV